MHIQGIQDSSRSTPLRVDAQRNLEHVLRAAREVFGELGYGAPMEDVARRARVGVGTVYRRFPSKDVLVRRIAEEETARLTEQAQAALGQEQQPWAALSRFLRTSVASGAGRLLPPRILRTGAAEEEAEIPAGAAVAEVGAGAGSARALDPLGSLTGFDDLGGRDALDSFSGEGRVPQQRQGEQIRQPGPGIRLLEQRTAPEAERTPRPDERADVRADVRADELGPGAFEPADPHSGEAELLDVVGRLVERARTAGELRTDVTVGDVLLVIATAAPMLPDSNQQAAASSRLLDILLEGLRSRPAT